MYIKSKLDNLTLPDEGQTAAPPRGDCMQAEASGASASVGNESEPAPLSSVSQSEEDTRIDEVWHKLEILGKIEPVLNAFYKRLNKLILVANDIKKIVGATAARYLITDQQVKRFEVDFIKHFDKHLQEKVQKEFQKFAFDLEHARTQAVYDFNKDIHSGWWFSHKVGWFLYMSNLITMLVAIAYCCLK